MKRFLAACTILFAALFDFLSRQGDEYMIKKSAKKKNLHKAVIGVFFFAMSLLISSASSGAVLYNNLDQPPLGQGTISNSYYKAQKFTTDGFYTLNWVNIRIRANTAGTIFAKIFSDASDLPGSEVGTLTAPSIGFIYANHTFTASGTINLSPNSTYWIVVGVTSGTGSYDWNYTDSNTGAGAGFSSRWAHSTDAGATWKGSDTEPFMMQVDVTALGPTITSFTPTTASTGATVTIAGSNFTGTTVKFGGTDAASFTVDSATQISAVLGTGSTGNVTVTTPGGTATSASTFTYNSSPATLAAGTPSSYKVTVTKVEVWHGTSWVTIFSGTAQLDMVAGGTFPEISNINLPAGTYSQVRVTFRNSFPVAGTVSYSGTAYYTTATAFFGQSNVASSPTTVAGSMAEFTFYNPDPAWGGLNADVTQTFSITPITVGPTTDYQPTLRFTISNTLLLKGTAGNPFSYFFSLDPPTGSLVEP